MKRKDIFFISVILAVYLVSGVVIAGSYIQKKYENMQQRPEEVREEIKKEEPQKPMENIPDKVPDKIPETVSENDLLTIGDEKPAEEQMPMQPVGREYFEDALFIGDSRTIGLKEYGDIKGAVFFADSGMSVFELWKKKIPFAHMGTVTFEEVLSERKYGKIYLMLGINELGYQFDSIEKKYRESVEKIREKQEDALIYLCANMHITREHSETDEIYNNENVNRVNEMICRLAEEKKAVYIDVNELFDDETGSLSTEYSSDSFHIYGKYYMEWAEWLCTKAVNK